MTIGKEAFRQAFVEAVDETLDAWLLSKGGGLKIKGAGAEAFPLFVEKLRALDAASEMTCAHPNHQEDIG